MREELRSPMSEGGANVNYFRREELRSPMSEGGELLFE